MTDMVRRPVWYCARLHVCLLCFVFVWFHFNLFIFNTRFLDQFFCCFPYLQFLIVSLFFCLTRLHDYMFACYLVFCIQLHVFFFLPCLHFRLLILLLFFRSFPCFRNLIKYYFCFFPGFLFCLFTCFPANPVFLSHKSTAQKRRWHMPQTVLTRWLLQQSARATTTAGLLLLFVC